MRSSSRTTFHTTCKFLEDKEMPNSWTSRYGDAIVLILGTIWCMPSTKTFNDINIQIYQTQLYRRRLKTSLCPGLCVVYAYKSLYVVILWRRWPTVISRSHTPGACLTRPGVRDMAILWLLRLLLISGPPCGVLLVQVVMPPIVLLYWRSKHRFG